MLPIKEFNELFNQHYNPFLRFATSYVRDTSIAEEITLEAFSTFWEKQNGELEIANHPAYILTIVKNLCLNHLKRVTLQQNTENRIQEVLEWELTTRINNLEACDPEYLYSKEVESIILKTIESLPEKTKEVFILSRLEHKTHKEIAESLSITTKGVEYHITQATKKLRVELKDYLPFTFLFFIKSLFFN